MALTKHISIGARFGRLTVEAIDSASQRRRRFLCRCDCGQQTTAYSFHLTSGATRSCGCLMVENRTLGNHDVRFERYIAMHAPELEDIKGTALEDFIPDWPCSWSVAINNSVMVKHRIAGGAHAIYNNTIKSGWSTVTGHLHALNVRRFSDYNGLRFGVDTGCLADPDSDAFDYTEDSPKDWASGFAVLSFDNSRLLWPEICYVDKGRVWFRGEELVKGSQAACRPARRSIRETHCS